MRRLLGKSVGDFKGTRPGACLVLVATRRTANADGRNNLAVRFNCNCAGQWPNPRHRQKRRPIGTILHQFGNLSAGIQLEYWPQRNKGVGLSKRCILGVNRAVIAFSWTLVWPERSTTATEMLYPDAEQEFTASLAASMARSNGRLYPLPVVSA